MTRRANASELVNVLGFRPWTSDDAIAATFGALTVGLIAAIALWRWTRHG